MRGRRGASCPGGSALLHRQHGVLCGGSWPRLPVTGSTRWGCAAVLRVGGRGKNPTWVWISSIGSRVAPSALCSIPKTLQGPPASPTRSPALRAPQAVLQGCSSQLPSALHPEGTQLCTAAALDAPCCSGCSVPPRRGEQLPLVLPAPCAEIKRTNRQTIFGWKNKGKGAASSSDGP